MTAAQLAELDAMSPADVIALGYVEAADGDTSLALKLAVEDALTLESRLHEAMKAVSSGFVRGVLPPA